MACRLVGAQPLSEPMLLIWPLGTKFNEIFIEIHAFSFRKMRLKMSSGKWRSFSLGLNVLIFVATAIIRNISRKGIADF